ncbi:trehalose-phosphatase [Microbacterium sp. gxy059]|uniref:trehalose-phosphatase n=1 Tax=Microbacterium sp. gxy059 TaxID=2957199 RepID=UPI003D9884DD
MTAADPVVRVAEAPRLLVALDFDGTLAPLVDEPMSARATPEAAAAITALAAAPGTTVAFVSGRTIADLRVIAEHDDASPVWLAGSHGAEHWRPAGAPPVDAGDADGGGGDPDVLAADAEAIVEGCAGAWIERKAFGFALHTRQADEAAEREAQRRVDALMAERAPEWRRRTGKRVVEYAWRHEGKDTAIADLRAATAADAVLFAGDDVTDEDALRSLAPGDLGIRVGPGETAADITVSDTRELSVLLDRIARIRAD